MDVCLGGEPGRAPTSNGEMIKNWGGGASRTRIPRDGKQGPRGLSPNRANNDARDDAADGPACLAYLRRPGLTISIRLRWRYVTRRYRQPPEPMLSPLKPARTVEHRF